MHSSLSRGAASQLARRIAFRPASASASASVSTSTSTSAFLRPRPRLHPSLQRQGQGQQHHQTFSTTHSPAFPPSAIPIPAASEPPTTMSSESTAPDQITPESLTSKLEQSLKTTHVSIQDMSGGCGQAFTAVIVSPDFEKKTLLARHRLVNGALKQEIAAIHAWTPKCLTPEQWEKEQERERAG